MDLTAYLTRIDLPILAAALFIAGLLTGMLVLYLIMRPGRDRLERQAADLSARIKTQESLAEERKLALAQAEDRLAATFGRLANESMSHQSESLLRLARESFGKHQETARAELGERERAIQQLVKPIQEALTKTQEQISSIEKERQQAFGSIRQQLEAMTQGQEALRSETGKLVKALRRPEVRGRWGELTLRRTVELAGMVEHSDFIEQAHTGTEAGAIRPDLIVHLPDRGTVVVDVKTPLDAYLDAVEAPDEASRNQAMQRHARNVANRVRELSAKSYWAQFERSPELVVLFIPGDQFLSAALSEMPNLMEEALRQRVILATPTSLIGLLKAVAYGWRQLALADNAEEIRKLAVDLYARLSTFTSHIVRMGRSLSSSVTAYNQAVGSLERMVLPGARKFTELGIQSREDIPEAAEIETAVREPADAGPSPAPAPAIERDPETPPDAVPGEPPKTH